MHLYECACVRVYIWERKSTCCMYKKEYRQSALSITFFFVFVNNVMKYVNRIKCIKFVCLCLCPIYCVCACLHSANLALYWEHHSNLRIPKEFFKAGPQIIMQFKYVYFLSVIEFCINQIIQFDSIFFFRSSEDQSILKIVNNE